MKGKGKLELVFKPDSVLVEGLLWRACEGSLYFCDIEKRSLSSFKPAEGKGGVFYRTSRKIGGFAFGPGGCIILFEENIVLKLHESGRTEELFCLDFPEGERFNDVTAGPCGRIYAGTMNDGLLLFEKGRMPLKLEMKVNCSNGMGFSPAGKIFYHTVTKDNQINAYDYDRSSGRISNKRQLVNFSRSNEWPDGLTVDGKGFLWSAFWTGGVKRISPEAEIVEEILVPAPNPTSLAFGGEEMNELFIATASSGIFRIKLPVAGMEEWPANF